MPDSPLLWYRVSTIKETVDVYAEKWASNDNWTAFMVSEKQVFTVHNIHLIAITIVEPSLAAKAAFEKQAKS